MTKSPFRRLAGTISNGISSIPWLHRLLRRAFLALPVGIRGPVIVIDALRELAAKQSPVFFIQIGANDGDQNDPIHHFVDHNGWKGILVEPVPRYFEELKRNYAGTTGLAFENIAISNSDAKREFWYLEDIGGSFPEWARGLGSFFKQEVTANKLPGIAVEDCLRSIEVLCLSVNGLLEKHGNPKVHCLIMDTQGYDAELIKQIDFTRMKPNLIIYEHILLSAEVKQATDDLLRAQGYKILSDRIDVVALLVTL